MSFIFAPAQEATTKVVVPVATQEVDQYEEHVFFATFERQLMEDLMKKYRILEVPSVMQEDGGDLPVVTCSELAKKYLKGWSEIRTADGKAMKFTKANVNKVFKDPIVARAFGAAYMKVLGGTNLTEKLVKNSETQAPTG